MKNFTIISYLSLMLATLAMAETGPKVMSAEVPINFELRIAAASLTKIAQAARIEQENIYFEERSGCICLRNKNEERSEICIPIITLSKLFEQYKNHAEIFPKSQRDPADLKHVNEQK